MDGHVAPLMYGFMRIDMIADEIEQCEARLSAYARSDGFDLATVFRECGDGAAFEELLGELKRSQARHVLVPTLEHLCGLPVPRQALKARLRNIGADVWPLPETKHHRMECR